MTEHKNLPTQLTNQALVNSTKGKHSLIARGMDALINIDNDAIYRHARNIFNDLTSNGVIFGSGEKRELQISEILKSFQDLAERNYGKAFFPIFTIYLCEQSRQKSIEDDLKKAEYFRKLALDWLHANEHLKDPEIWCDLGVLYMHEDNQLVSHYFKKGSDIGDANSMWLFSCAYSWGYGAEYNKGKALYWNIKAALNGHNKAHEVLKFRHEDGDLDIEDKQVFDWYVWSAEQGEVWAQVHLADVFSDENEIENDGVLSALRKKYAPALSNKTLRPASYNSKEPMDFASYIHYLGNALEKQRPSLQINDQQFSECGMRALIRLTIKLNGDIDTVEVLRPGSISVFNDSAIRIIHNAAPFNPLPISWKLDRCSFYTTVEVTDNKLVFKMM